MEELRSALNLPEGDHVLRVGLRVVVGHVDLGVAAAVHRRVVELVTMAHGGRGRVCLAAAELAHDDAADEDALEALVADARVFRI